MNKKKKKLILFKYNTIEKLLKYCNQDKCERKGIGIQKEGGQREREGAKLEERKMSDKLTYRIFCYNLFLRNNCPFQNL